MCEGQGENFKFSANNFIIKIKDDNRSSVEIYKSIYLSKCRQIIINNFLFETTNSVYDAKDAFEEFKL